MTPGFVLRVVAALLLVAPLAACGETKAGDPATTADAPTGHAAQWLLRVTSFADDGGELQLAHYLWVSPESGQLEVIDGDTFMESASGRETTLLVDSSRHWAVSASGAQNGAPEVGLIDLSEGTKQPLVSDVSGARWWSFDHEDAAVLRMIKDDGSIWRVDVTTGKADPDGTLVAQVDEYGYFFDADNGQPYVVDLDNGAFRPSGLGDEPKKPVVWNEGSLQFGRTGVASCPENAGFEDNQHAVTVFCLEGDKLEVRTQAEGESAFATVGDPIALPFHASAIDFALPPTG